jgi:hypothetical protein
MSKHRETTLFYEVVFEDDFSGTKNKETITPVIRPVRTERNITIARDASNLQKKKEMVTGTAF